VVSRAIQREIVEGRGTEHGGVYLDLSTLTPEFLQNNAGHFMALLAKNGIDPLTSLLEIAPAVHFCMGGIKINAFCETGIKGLFAAGEVTAGVHGANRLSSNGLTEALVFGRIAGQQAGRRTVERFSGQPKFPGWHSYLARNEDRRPLNVDQIRAMITLVKKCMLKAGGMERDCATLDSGISQLKKLRGEVVNVRPQDPSVLVEYSRLNNGIILGLAVLTSALVREESRGAHFRSDFPDKEDAKWLQNIEVNWENGELLTSC
jgi:fumarate reductase (CoM/CoB) subunit A